MSHIISPLAPQNCTLQGFQLFFPDLLYSSLSKTGGKEKKQWVCLCNYINESGPVQEHQRQVKGNGRQSMSSHTVKL